MSAYCMAREAQRASIQVRKKVGASRDEPLAVVDVAIELGIHVSIMALSSAEGMWCKEKRAIVLTSLRPPGRRAHTCAHEIGHFHFGHGTSVDELLENRVRHERSPDEILADQFAGFLLMPPFATESTMKDRGWAPNSLTPPQAYTLANYFGVSYGGFLNHLHFSLRLISEATFERLKTIQPKAIRASLLPPQDSSHVVVVDNFWQCRAIDLETGDHLLVPKGASVDTTIFSKPEAFDGLMTACAEREGVTKLTLQGRNDPLTVRVCAKEYHGYGTNRFPERNNVYDPSEADYR